MIFRGKNGTQRTNSGLSLRNHLIEKTGSTLLHTRRDHNLDRETTNKTRPPHIDSRQRQHTETEKCTTYHAESLPQEEPDVSVHLYGRPTKIIRRIFEINYCWRVLALGKKNTGNFDILTDSTQNNFSQFSTGRITNNRTQKINYDSHTTATYE